jgi:hypothetical protein
MTRSLCAFASVLLLVLATVPAADAQGSLRDQTRGLGTGEPPREPAPDRTADRGQPSRERPVHVISVNPFLPLAGYAQGEYERKVDEQLAFAIAGSFVRFDEEYLNLDAKLRLYPMERGLEGLGLAAGLGIGRARQNAQSLECAPAELCPDALPGRNVTAPAFSIEGHYQWLLGTSRKTAITAGGGLKRYFVSEERALGINRIVPTGRLTIGYAF